MKKLILVPILMMAMFATAAMAQAPAAGGGGVEQKETATPRGQTTGSPNEMNGTVTITFKKNGADWQAVLVHIAVTGIENPPCGVSIFLALIPLTS